MAENISAHRSGWLEELARQQFTPEGKAERVKRALAALYEEEPIKLSPTDWKWVAEDVDLEDQS
jgi:lipoate-protein ligase A